MSDYKSDSLYHIFHQVIGLHYYRAHRLLEKEGVYPGQPPMLFALHMQDGQSQKELAKKLNIQPATITMMVKRMTKAGLIERRQDEKDQRVSRVYLTEEGREVRKKVFETIKGIEEECFGNFAEEDKELLRRLLFQIKENLSSVCGDKFNGLCHEKNESKHYK